MPNVTPNAGATAAPHAGPRGAWDAGRRAARAHPPAGHPAPQRDRVRPAALWVGVFGVPALWTVQTLVGYPLLSHFCYPARVPLARPASGGAWATALVVSVLALAGALAVGAVALRSWRATRGENHGEDPEGEEATSVGEVGEGRTRFMAFAGVMISALFLLGVVLNGVPLFVVPTCR